MLKSQQGMELVKTAYQIGRYPQLENKRSLRIMNRIPQLKTCMNVSSTVLNIHERHDFIFNGESRSDPTS